MDLSRFKKPLIQGGLVLLFFVLLALWTNWFFSLIVIGLMLVHEYGHIWAFKRNGILIRGMYFIPFLGAFIIPSGGIKSRKEEAFISVMGPAFGFALGITLCTAYLVTGNPTIAAIALINGIFNLFNMIPVTPLDGGRVAKSIVLSAFPRYGMAIMIFGLATALGAAILTGKFFLGIAVAFLGMIDILNERQLKAEGMILPAMPTRKILLWTALYLLLSFGLYVMTDALLNVPHLNAALLALIS